MKDGKLQLLYTMKLLLEETDRDHILNAVDICNILETRWDLSSTRKTVFMDVEKLRDYGMKIEQVKGKVQGYYVVVMNLEDWTASTRSFNSGRVNSLSST